MSNIKKFLFFLCLIIVAFAVTACGSEDTVNPSLVIPNPTITHVVNEDVDLLKDITATDNESAAADIKIEISDLGGYDKTKVGTYTVTIKATDKAGNSVTQTITVKVTEVPDTVAPTLTIGKSEIIHEVNDAKINLLADVTATDNVDAASDITISISDYNGYDKSVEGTYVITVKATDKSGNFSTGTITVIVKADILPPMVTGAVTTITHLAGETVDLTKGLEGVDDKDGTNVIFTVTDYKNYNKSAPGTYTVEITASDSSGNEGKPFSRTVVVEEAYARAEMTSFEGETIRYEALYNPQIMNGNTGTGFNTAYDGHYVNVLSKEYLEWILEYAPERLGAGVGWSVIAVTDANEKIVYVRHWNSGEAYHDKDGKLVSEKAVNWSTGTNRNWTVDVGGQTVAMTNAKYSSAEMGLMMANINEWVPKGGHVFIFINWTTIGKDDQGKLVPIANSPTMPRAMGAKYIMASDEDGDDVMDYAIGRSLKILDAKLTDKTVRQSFDPAKPFPIISIPSVRYVTATGVWKNRYTETVYLDEYTEEHPYNPLLGVSANDGKGADITSSITYKIFRYQTTEVAYGILSSLPINDPRWGLYLEEAALWKMADSEVTLEQMMVPANNNYHFVVQYQVSANGHTDTAYKLVQIKAMVPDYIDLYGATDSVFSEAMGIQQRLDMNPNLSIFLSFVVWVLAAAILIATVFVGVRVYIKYDKEYEPQFQGKYFRELPAEYSPAEMSYLYYFKKIQNEDVTATLLDLVRRKYLILDNNTSDINDKNPAFKITKNLAMNEDDLLPHEKHLISWFIDIVGDGKEVSLDQIEKYPKRSYQAAMKFEKAGSTFITLAKQAGSRHDFFEKTLASAKGKLYSWCFVPFVFTFLAFISGSMLAVPIDNTLPALMSALVGVAYVIYVATIKKRSVNGNEDYTKWKAFRQFLLDFGRMEDYPIPGVVVWEHYLVYATSLKVADKVMEQLEVKLPAEMIESEQATYMGIGYRYYGFRLGYALGRINQSVSTARANGRATIAAHQAQVSGSGRGGGFGGGRSFGGGGGGFRGR